MKTKLTDYLPLAAIAAGAFLFTKKQSVSGVGSSITLEQFKRIEEGYVLSISNMILRGDFVEAYEEAMRLYSYPYDEPHPIIFWASIYYTKEMCDAGNYKEAKDAYCNALAVFASNTDLGERAERYLNNIHNRLYA